MTKNDKWKCGFKGVSVEFEKMKEPRLNTIYLHPIKAIEGGIWYHLRT